MYVKRNPEVQWKSSKYYTTRVCVCVCVFFGIQHAMRISRILSSVACPPLQYFSQLSHKRQDFRRKVIENKMCVLILSTTFVNISHSKKNWARYDQNTNWSTSKLPVTLYQILTKNFVDRFFEKYSNIQIHENPSSGSRGVPYGRMDRQTWRN
jgi:hypothetical protein